MEIQERNDYCVCAVLSDIFLNYNIILPQDEIAKRLTPTEKGFNIEDEKFVNFMKLVGFDYNFYWWNQTPFNEPGSILEDISKNEGFLGLKNHTYRVIEFSDPLIRVIDPKDGGDKDFSLGNLMKEFGEFDGGFGLIKRINI